MRKLILALPLLALSACGATQTDLRKAGYDTIQAYNATAPLALSYIQQPSADPTLKADIKTASADAIKVIDPLGADLQSGDVLTAVEISAAEAAVAALEAKISTTTTGATTQ